uniref:Uncharacterized protein n=1 Tax=Phenylobacterium glaciei TaxID=2803784 RepID=A0A974P0V6_9CAUL|nr:hypothetical protein JKL49_15745 [Phenylobacterium glaciei]
MPAGMNWLLEHIPNYDKWYRFFLFWMVTDGLLDGCGPILPGRATRRPCPRPTRCSGPWSPRPCGCRPRGGRTWWTR